MKCPFISGDCLGRDCPGWSLGRCFLESILQKMDNISLKLDTLCNLSSIMMTHVTAPKVKQAGPERPVKSAPEKEQNGSGEPTLWAMAEDVPKPDKASNKEAFHADHAPDAASQFEQYAFAKSGDIEQDTAGETLEAEIHLDMPDHELLPGFPTKVSDIIFADEAEAQPDQAGVSAHAIKPEELSLEAPIAEEIAAEIVDDLTINERILLTTQPSNGSGMTGIPYEGILTEFYEGLSSDVPEDGPAESTPDITLEEAVASAEKPAVPSEAESKEDEAAPASVERLSVEAVVNDIAGNAEPQTPEAPAPDLPPDVAAEATLKEPTLESTAESGEAQPEQIILASAEHQPASSIKEEEKQESPPEPEAVHEEAIPEPEPVQIAGSSAEAEPYVEAMPAGAGVEVAVEELQEPEGEMAGTTDPASWVPVEIVQAQGEAVLGIDFGSASSKVALKPNSTEPAVAVPLALTAYNILHKAGLMSHFTSQNEYVEESLLYFDPNEFAFCGSLAKKLAQEASESGAARPAIQNLKTFLIRGGANLQIHRDFFPASESLDSQSVLALYLAYLLRLTRHYLEKRSAKIGVDLDTTIRAFAIPTWIEERYKEDVKRLFRGAAAYAFCLERWLKDDLIKGVRVPDLRKALAEARQYRAKIEENLMGPIMTESVAVGNARLLGLAHERVHPLSLLIVNVGAGFTDFALFNITYPEARDAKLTAQVSYKGGVGTGLGVWDNALKTLLFNRVREDAAARKKINEFRLFKATLELKAKDIKESLMAGEGSLAVDVSPMMGEPVLVERSELESSLPVKAALFGIRDGLRTYIKEAIKAVGMHRFDPGFTEILVTGGGAYLPSVVDCVREAVATLGPAYPGKVRSDYISALYTSLPNIGALYPMVAASLGSTEKECPDEQAATATIAAPAATAGPAASSRTPVDKPGQPTARNRVAAKFMNKLRLA